MIRHLPLESKTIPPFSFPPSPNHPPNLKLYITSPCTTFYYPNDQPTKMGNCLTRHQQPSQDGYPSSAISYPFPPASAYDVHVPPPRRSHHHHHHHTSHNTPSSSHHHHHNPKHRAGPGGGGGRGGLMGARGAPAGGICGCGSDCECECVRGGCGGCGGGGGGRIAGGGGTVGIVGSGWGEWGGYCR